MIQFFASVLVALIVAAFANRLGMNHAALGFMALVATFLAIDASRTRKPKQ